MKNSQALNKLLFNGSQNLGKAARRIVYGKHFLLKSQHYIKISYFRNLNFLFLGPEKFIFQLNRLRPRAYLDYFLRRHKLLLRCLISIGPYYPNQLGVSSPPA
jgi:hypothetical protein